MFRQIQRFMAVLTSFVVLTAFASTDKFPVHAVSGAEAIVEIALAEEGYTEGANNDNKYGEWYKLNNAAWCAIFISWCADQAGIPESIIKKNAWAGDMGSTQKTGNFGGTYYPKSSITPKVGDIVYYDWNSNNSSDHVEIVVSVNEGSKTFTSIGGNTKGDEQGSEGVRRHSNYSFTSSYITGFERPAYTEIINDDELGIPYPRPNGSEYLSNGSTGTKVKWLQIALNQAINAGLDVDGVFSSGTESALKSFQTAYGLEVDGIAGPATINKMVDVLSQAVTSLDAPSVNVTAIDASSLSITWTAVENAGSYRIDRRMAGAEAYETIKTTTGTSYTDTGLLPATKYYYRVYALNGSVKSEKQGGVGAFTSIDAPSVTVSTIDSYSLSITWTAVEGAESYRVDRRMDGTDDYNTIYITSGTSYTDTGLSPATRYYYRIYAVNESVKSQKQNGVGAFTSIDPPVVAVHTIDAFSLSITWTAVEGAESYRIDRRMAGADAYETIATVIATSYNDTELLPATKYYYRVYALNGSVKSEKQGGIGEYTQSKFTVTFDANGGSCTTAAKSVTYNSTYGELPIPSRTGYSFIGWYTPGFTSSFTSLCSGTKITSDSKVTITANQTLHAHWEKIIISGDVNDDSTLSVADAVLLQKRLLGSGSLTNWQAGDLCEDGKIDAFDLAMLKRLLLQK